MKFRNLLVSEDNQLVLSDYGLSEGEAEVLDLNRSLTDVITDPELKSFIIENAIDPQKIYIFCVKEDFGNNDQLLEDIPNIKEIDKGLKKNYKKIRNIYFFVYNTHLKNDDVVNPSIEEQQPVEAEYQEVVDSQDMPVEVVVNEEIPGQEEQVEVVVDENLPYQEEEVVTVSQEEMPYQEEVVEVYNEEPYQEEVVVETSNEDLPYQEETVEVYNEEPYQEEVQVSNEDLPYQDEVIVEQQPELLAQDEEPAQYAYNENSAVESQEALDNLEHFEEKPEVIVTEQQPEFVTDADELERIVDDGIDKFDSPESDRIREDIFISNENVDAPVSEDVVLFNEPEMIKDENLPITEVISDSVDSVALENNYDQEIPVNENGQIDYNDGQTMVEMPASFFDVEREDEISYEDYNEFVNDYELNIHALKSIYDFIWRILVLNNYNLKINDLLYIAVNNLDAFSIGQSDFVRQTANKAESLFDLILQLDIKLEFNNSLFYIYLAEFFKISGNKIIVNEKFLDTISIWVNNASKEKFISQVEQFMNYSSIYNKKIVFSYFIELANFVKGKLPSINSNITLLDVHRLLNNKYNKIRNENVFAYMVKRMNQILEANGVVIEMYLVKTPDSMFGIEVNNPEDQISDSWKSQLALLYKKLMENILSYILLKGNKEVEIFNLFLDIRDLRMYQDLDESRNVLAPETVSAISGRDSGYLTIGDELGRLEAIVPSQRSQVQYNYLTPQAYVENLEKGYPMERKFGNNVVNAATDDLTYPQEVKLTNGEINTIRENYASRFNVAEFETSISRRIEEYERKIKNNISRIEAERKQLREKMEELKNI